MGCNECRPKFVSDLKAKLEGVRDQLCGDCQRRSITNPLRVLDCKVPQDQPIIDTLPSILDHLCEVCRTHFDKVRLLLSDRAIPFLVRPRLVRGLDYYMRTTFEFVHQGALGSQNSVLGGGRYDGLAEQLGSKVHSPGIGFSIGEDRLVMSIEETLPAEHRHKIDLFIAPLGETAVRHCAQLAYDLRKAGKVVELGADGKLKRALEQANKLAARFALIVGDNEINAGRYALKNMTSGEQVEVAREDLAARIG
ncbi:MAG: His/Gly/Thr/Pro-type tRNA ligase C-terminal domain-containing protein [Bryobacteraceae bacterium]